MKVSRSPVFSFSDSRCVLENMPAVLRTLLLPLPEALHTVSEGDSTWSPLQVVCHLAWGEVDDWVPRVRRILTEGTARPFEPFDREVGFERYAGWDMEALLDEFSRLRAASMKDMDEFGLRSEQMTLEGLHPEFGRVTLGQLLATWVTHDFAHLAQISRVLTRHHGQFIGPWRPYFSLLRDE